jgi:hypothetical protein
MDWSACLLSMRTALRKVSLSFQLCSFPVCVENLIRVCISETEWTVFRILVFFVHSLFEFDRTHKCSVYHSVLWCLVLKKRFS